MVAKRYRLGNDYELDLGAYELRRSGRPLRLPRIPMELLRLLTERRGLLVTREQIVERIWGNTVLDTDNSINAAIRKIRLALRDDPERPEFLQTVTAKGYRFIAPVVELESFPVTEINAKSQVPGGAGQEADSQLPAEPVELSGSGTQRHWLRWPLAVLTALALFGVAGFVLKSRDKNQPAVAIGRLTLAVLPFDNLTGDTGQEYFSDGLTEEMMTALGRCNPERLSVIGRTSVMFYKRNPKPLDQIGRELGVQYVLAGSVRRDADKVRITAQLIRVSDQTHIWAREYDRELKDLLVMEGEIALEVSDEIQDALGDRRRSVAVSQPTLSPSMYEAHNLYLKGRYFWNKRTVTGFRQAIGFFEQATARDAACARAYAGLADCYALLGGYTGNLQTEYMRRARAAALHALELDDKLPEAHTALALISQNYDWDWQTAEKEYRRAIVLNPNYATAHHWYAEHLAWRGRFDEALAEIDRARQLDPLSLIIAADDGVILYYSRQYDRALNQFRTVLEMDPDFSRAAMIEWVYLQKGMYPEALAANARMPHDLPWYWSFLAYAHGRSRRPLEEERDVQKLLELNKRQPVDPGVIALAYVGADRRDETLLWLEKACAQHSNVVIALRVDPAFDPLRGDPRYHELLRRVGLSQ